MNILDNDKGVTYNGIRSTELGIGLVYGENNWLGAQYSATLSQIPGRSSETITPDHRYNNIDQVIYFGLRTSHPMRETSRLSQSVSQWLLSPEPNAYSKLLYDFSPDYYYMAVPTAISEYTVQAGVAVSFSVTFSCLPYAYEVAGQKYRDVTSGLETTRLGRIDALPLWHISGGNGNGSFTVNGTEYDFVGLSGDLWVDSETEEAYDAAGNFMGNLLRFPNYQFPRLIPGKNVIGNVSNMRLEVMPRWRILM